jgi:alpha-aminoadipic semialdehyde synthase
MYSFGAIGLLEPSKPIVLDRWSSLARLALEQKFGLSLPAGDLPSLKSALAGVLPTSHIPALLEALSWLHLIPSASSPTPTTMGSRQPPVPALPIAPADALAQHLAHALRYAPHERDLVLLHHEIVSRDRHSGTEQVHTSTLTAYGDARASAMARTVGLPVAFAARRVLDGAVRATGVCGPTVDEAVWKGVLKGLESRGLGVRESVKSEPSMEGALAAGLRQRTIAGGYCTRRSTDEAGKAESFSRNFSLDTARDWMQ